MKEAIKLAIEDGIEDLEKYKDEEIYLDCLRIKNNEIIEILESLIIGLNVTAENMTGNIIDGNEKAIRENIKDMKEIICEIEKEIR